MRLTKQHNSLRKASSSWWLLLLAPTVLGWIHPARAFQLPRGTWTKFELSAVPIEGYHEAFRIIDQCAETGELTTELENAVRFLEVNSYKIYPAKDPSHRQELWEKAQGSWKLTASTGSHKTRSFHPPPKFLPFSFAMIDGTHFGNGIGLNDKQVGLAFLHHAHYHAAHRRLTVTHPDVYLFGHKVNVPDFMRPAVLKETEDDESSTTTSGEHINGAVAKKKTNNNQKDQHDPPTFVLIGASDKALIARGNQSGGIALWTRLPQDIRPVAYKGYPDSSLSTDFHLLPQ